MKIKILGQFSYQTYPGTSDMIEISDKDLEAVKMQTKCFNAEKTGVEKYKKPSPTAEEIEAKYRQAVINGIRAKYTADDEIAILRQKEEKPIEYQAYFDFCEQCKSKARGGTPM